MKSMQRLLPTLTVLLLLAACGGPDAKPVEEPSGPLVSKATPSAATLEKLAAADRMDGSEDKVIALCPSCGLHMAGKPEFSCKIGDYTTHSCAERCNHAVCDDPDEVFTKIEVTK